MPYTDHEPDDTLTDEELEEQTGKALPADDDDGEGGSSEEESRTNSRPWTWLIVCAPLLICLFGAGREVWSLGLAAVLMGLFMILNAPLRKLPTVPLWALVTLLLAPLPTLLPVGWAGVTPAWRTDLVQAWSLRLPGTISAQPAVTFEAWLVLACCVMWLWCCLGQGFSENHRRLCMRVLVVGGTLLALLSLLEHWGTLSLPWWPRDRKVWGAGFGPFANRNHISSLCAITCVLAAAGAYDSYRRRSRWWIVCALSFIVPLATIFVNTSRGGLLLFFMGMTLWLGTAAMRRGFFKKLTVTAAMVIGVVSVLMVAGGSLSQRLTSGDNLAALANDLRLALAGEALSMGAAAPWLGVGLGNFSSVYPLVTNLHAADARSLHPESDLLWLLTEGGLTTLLPCLVLVFWFQSVSGLWSVHRGKQKTGRSDRRLRKAAAIAAALSLMHSVIDVPNHGVGYFMLTALLLGLALRRRRQEVSSLHHPWVFRSIGLIVICMGVCWIAISQDIITPPLPSAAHRLHERAMRQSLAGDPAGALLKVQRALQTLPLDYRLHYFSGQLRLNLGQPHERALLDFGRARAMEPHFARFCYEEGVFWLAHHPATAIIPWREYLRRNRHSAEFIWGGYRQILNDAEPYPELRRPLWLLADSPSMKLIFLMIARPGEEWQNCLDELLAEHPSLDGMEGLQLQQFFRAWQQRGNRDQLVQALESHTRWQLHAWRILAEEHAQRANYQAAYSTVAKYLPPLSKPVSSLSLDLLQVERAFLFNPADPLKGVELYQAQRAKGQLDDALRTLEKVSQLPNAPLFIKREIAAIQASKENYRRAWELMQEVMTAIPDEPVVTEIAPDDMPELPPKRKPGAGYE